MNTELKNAVMATDRDAQYDMREKKSPKRLENYYRQKTQGCVIHVYTFLRFL